MNKTLHYPWESCCGAPQLVCPLTQAGRSHMDGISSSRPSYISWESGTAYGCHPPKPTEELHISVSGILGLKFKEKEYHHIGLPHHEVLWPNWSTFWGLKQYFLLARGQQMEFWNIKSRVCSGPNHNNQIMEGLTYMPSPVPGSGSNFAPSLKETANPFTLMIYFVR